MANLKDSYVEPKPRQYNANGTFRSRINYSVRKQLQRMLDEGRMIKDIALALNITRQQIWFERNRCKGAYNADEAEENKNTSSISVKSTGLPIYAHQNLVQVYKYLESALGENKPTKCREYIKMCMNILKEMGVATAIEKRKPITDEQKREVIKLYYQKETYRNISAKLGISVSSVEKIVKKEKSGESYDEYIKSKWSS